MGKCAKQTVIAIIETIDGEYFLGQNTCNVPQLICPRKDMKTGEGYEMCKEICHQKNHAEVNACIKAGIKAIGGTLYLLGHTYLCKQCEMIVKDCGIVEIKIGENPFEKLNKKEK
jgi:deoxycytidylate deaminase